MTSNVSTVSGFVAKGHQTMTSRFRKPPYDPGRPDLPGPVLTLESVLLLPSYRRGSLNGDAYPPLPTVVYL